MWFSTPQKAPQPLKASRAVAVTLAHANRLLDVHQRAQQVDSGEQRFKRGIFVIGALSTLIVALNDGLVLTTGLWLVGMIVLGRSVFPFIEFLAQRVRNFYLAFAIGSSGCVVGLSTAVLFGPLHGMLTPGASSSFESGLFALAVFPPFTFSVGIILVGILDLASWLWTGQSFTGRLGNLMLDAKAPLPKPN